MSGRPHRARNTPPPYCHRWGKPLANSVGRPAAGTRAGRAGCAEGPGTRREVRRGGATGPLATGGAGADRLGPGGLPDRADDEGAVVGRARVTPPRSGQPLGSGGRRTCPVASSLLPAAPLRTVSGLVPVRGRAWAGRSRGTGIPGVGAPLLREKGVLPGESRTAERVRADPERHGRSRAPLRRVIRLDESSFFSRSRGWPGGGERGGSGQRLPPTSSSGGDTRRRLASLCSYSSRHRAGRARPRCGRNP